MLDTCRTGEAAEEYTKWSNWYYSEVCTDLWSQDIEPGDFICLDACGIDVGLLGSNNTLACKKKGAVAFMTNGGGIRDTNEVILQNTLVWSKLISQPMDQAHIRFLEKDIPIAIGGVAIYPGDIVVADGDGVIVISRSIITDVAKHAWLEASADKKACRQLYLVLGMELDSTV